MTTLSIVSGTRHRPECYQRFLSSVIANATIPAEVIVMDASDEKTYTEDFTSGLVTVRTFHENPRRGTLRGYNLGFRQCTGRWVCWLNDDCEVLPGWDKTAVEYLEKHPEMVGCVYWRDNAGRRPDSPFQVQSLNGIVYPNFAVFSRELGEKIGWFDESIGWMYGCDTDFGYSAIWQGHPVAPIPGCKILHYREMDEERATNAQIALGRGDSKMHDRKLFDAKWVPRLSELREKAAALNYLDQPRTTR